MKRISLALILLVAALSFTASSCSVPTEPVRNATKGLGGVLRFMSMFGKSAAPAVSDSPISSVRRF